MIRVPDAALEASCKGMLTVGPFGIGQRSGEKPSGRSPGDCGRRHLACASTPLQKSPSDAIWVAISLFSCFFGPLRVEGFEILFHEMEVDKLSFTSSKVKRQLAPPIATQFANYVGIVKGGTLRLTVFLADQFLRLLFRASGGLRAAMYRPRFFLPRRTHPYDTFSRHVRRPFAVVLAVAAAAI